MKSPGSDDDAEDEEISKQGDDNDQSVETHDQIIRHFEIFLIKVDTIINSFGLKFHSWKVNSKYVVPLKCSYRL